MTRNVTTTYVNKSYLECGFALTLLRSILHSKHVKVINSDANMNAKTSTAEMRIKMTLTLAKHASGRISNSS
jgi:hypothetical protein